MNQQSIAAATRQRIGSVGVWLATLNRIGVAAERDAARRIEELGYGALWINENPSSREALVHSGLLLAATDRITVGTGIANIWVRDATATHNGAHALAEAYPGRFLLGLGVSHAPLVGARGHDYGRPLAAMRGYLDGLEQAKYLPPQPEQPVPTVLAALRPKMIELAGTRADGVHSYFVTPEHTALAREVLGTGPLLAPEQAVVLETDPAKARALAREHTKYYLVLPNYLNNLRTLGFTEDDFADGGSDRLVDAIVAWGDEDAIRDRVRRHLAAGADHVAIQPLATDVAGSVADLGTLAPALLES